MEADTVFDAVQGVKMEINHLSLLLALVSGAASLEKKLKSPIYLCNCTTFFTRLNNVYKIKNKNNNCPLTASTDCIKWQLFQIFTCLYRKYPMMWCHLWPHQVRSTCAKLQGFWLVRLYYPCGSHDHCLFSLTLIGLGRSYDLNKKPLQFST